MKDFKLIGGLFGTSLSASSIALSSAELDHIVSITTAILGVIIVLITSVIIPTISKIKKAKENDGKIDKEEAKEIAETISNGIDDVKNAIDDAKNKGKEK